MEIVINEQLYNIDKESKIGYGTTSDVYRLKHDNLDLAVKIYNTSFTEADRKQAVENIKVFSEIAEDTYPILLSTNVVTDIDGNCIGCTTPYINSSKKEEYPIFNLPCETFFNYIDEIREKRKIMSRNHIMMLDCNFDNIKLGTISYIPDIERIYLFDDDLYRIYDCSDEDKLNELNNDSIDDLIGGMMFSHYKKIVNHDEKFPMCSASQLYELFKSEFDQSRLLKDLLDYYYVKKLK